MKGTVLLLDDNLVDLKAASAVMTREGYDCHAFTDPPQALEWLKTNRPRLIFLDLQMPGASGFDLIPVINRLCADFEMLLVIMSGKNQQDDVRKAISLGAKDYVIKPVDPLVLLEKLKRIESKADGFFEISVSQEEFSPSLVAHSFQILTLSEFGLSGISAIPLQVGEIFTMPSLPVPLFSGGRAMVRALACVPANGGYDCKLTFVGLPESTRQELRVFCRAAWVKQKGAA